MDSFNLELGLKIPNHVAFILDGNGRWAKKKHLPKSVGHAKGAEVVEKICEYAYDLGVKYLTVYAFSTENWNRSEDEVNALMKLLRNYLKDCIKRASKNNMRVMCIGSRDRLSPDIVESIRDLEEATKNNDGLFFTIALNYGSRDEITRAVRRIADDVKAGNISSDDISETLISKYLDTSILPDPDLLIRTSGEQRLSNYLLWQIAYTEFYFPEVLLPDFKKSDLIEAIKAYNGRDRRFGKRNEDNEQ